MLSLVRWIGLVACGLLLSGCWPTSQAPLDEQKESNFLTGRARAQDRDWDGAIEAFEKAMEANPHSASAHFEIAQIYEQHKQDFAAALYHYEKARRLRPNGYPADLAGERLEGCKRELAKTVTQPPNMDALQRENEQLKAEVQRLRQTVLEWQKYYRGDLRAMPGPVIHPGPEPGAGRGNTVSGGGGSNGPTRTTTPGPVGPAPTGGRTHKVAAGENPSKIAARYGVKLSALKAANPGLVDRSLKVGQTLVIPAP
jgi:tetratricopeptide (TPR) repeat protein